jgi:phosphoribosylamine-glycine ligase
MGAYGPPSFVDPSLKKKIEETIVEKVWEGIQKEKIPYRGVLYLGLMVVDGEPFVLEFNVRFGDPECQVLMALLEDELLPYLFSTARGELSTLPPPPPPKQYALSVVFVALGYPSTYRKGIEFTLPTPPPSFTWIHAGTEKKGDRWVSTGGRVVNLVGSSPSFPSLWETLYDFVKNHPIPGLFFREDIGFSELSYHTSL